MKNILKGIFAVASMALIGCSQDEQLVVMNDTSETFTGVMEVSESRTGLGENGNVVWSDEDAISIFKMSGYHQKYQVEKGGSTTATFKYANESKEHNANLTMNYAVYPYNSNHSIDNNGKITLDLSSLANQEYTEGSFENGQSAMVAKSSSQDLPFFNTLAMLRVKLCSEVPGDYSIKSITLTSASKALSGTATVDMSQDKPQAVFDDNGNKTITLTCTQPVQLKEDCDGTTGGHDFYILVPVGTYSANDLTIKIEGENSEILYEASYTKELKLERSGITTIHHEFGEEDWSGYIEPSVVSTSEQLKTAIANGETNVELANDITVDKWIMFSETLSVANGNIITVKIDGLTIHGNGHTLTVNSIESAGNGNRLFHDASKLNISNLTIKYADGLAGGIGLKSGVISHVNFVGGGYGILPGAGNIKVESCTFATNSDALYFEQERDNLTVTGCTFNQPNDKNVILLRGNVEFTNNIVNSGRTVNIVSGSPVVTGNNFTNVRLKVYSAATATVSGNTINNLEFETTTYSSNFDGNTLSTAAQAALDAVTKN